MEIDKLSFSTHGSEILITFREVELKPLLESRTEEMGGSSVHEVFLSRRVIAGHGDGVDMEALYPISAVMFDTLRKQPEDILYFYCDVKGDNLKVNARNKQITPQAYRSHLFSLLFDRETRRRGETAFVNEVLPVDCDGEVLYLHFIYDRRISERVDLLKNALEDMKAK